MSSTIAVMLIGSEALRAGTWPPRVEDLASICDQLCELVGVDKVEPPRLVLADNKGVAHALFAQMASPLNQAGFTAPKLSALSFVALPVLRRFAPRVGGIHTVSANQPSTIVINEEAASRFTPDQRTWVVVHELTHHVQGFLAPWLRPEMNDAVSSILRATKQEREGETLTRRAERATVAKTLLESHAEFCAQSLLPSMQSPRHTVQLSKLSKALQSIPPFSTVLAELSGAYEQGLPLIEATVARLHTKGHGVLFALDTFPTKADLVAPFLYLEKVAPQPPEEPLTRFQRATGALKSLFKRPSPSL